MKTLPLLVLGSKNYSSWSLRPWLFLRKAQFEFEERIIYFDATDYQEQIKAWSPSGRVPLLIQGDLKIWDSLSICEYVADCTGSGWPAARAERALARSVAAEMHSGFQALRTQCPMNVRARERTVAMTADLTRDIARIDEVWTMCRRSHAAGGRWLFGDFCIADAMFAPVAFRFQTYGAELSPESQAYLRTVLADSSMCEWEAAALAEGHPLPEVDKLGIRLQLPSSKE